MDIAAPTSTAYLPPAGAPTEAAIASDYDTFLLMLTTQMQNQDPLEPMKSSDYVAQIATFSQVEQSVELNGRLAELLTSSQLAQAEGMIGRSITSADGKVSGEVVAARIVESGVVATLADGQELRIEQGVAIGGRV